MYTVEMKHGQRFARLMLNGKFFCNIGMYSNTTSIKLQETAQQIANALNTRPESAPKTIYAVLENNKPAKWPECNVDPSWDRNEFESLLDAMQYLHKWLGIHSIWTEMPRDIQDSNLVVNVDYPYSGYGDTITIKVKE